MGTLSIFLFGSVRVIKGSWQEEIKLTRTIQLLLAYLILERKRLHPREALVEQFWSDYDPERARNCLNTALWRLRKALEPLDEDQGKYLITSHTSEVGFNPECDCWLDVAVFENLSNRILTEPVEGVAPEKVQELERVLALYTGDLLEGVYEDWALVPREHQRLLYISGLDYLMRFYYHQANYPQSIKYGKAILNLDPLREEIHRSLMQVYMECGQRSLAVRQYETCCQQLLHELGIPPMEETRALYDRIIGVAQPLQAGKPKGPSHLTSPNGDLELILRELYRASKKLEQANKQFSQILQQLEKYTSSNS